MLPHVIRKDAAIENVGSDDDFPGQFRVVLSAPTEDRDGETLLPSEWKMPLPDHITFDVDHGMSVESTVGSGTPEIEEATGNLIVAGTYSSLQKAQDVRTLVNEKHIRTTSVAFMSLPDTTKGAAKGAKVRELLNGAFVAVPSNREAIVLESKGVKAGARNSSSDAELIQQIHDAAIALGASADAAPADETPAKAAKAVEKFGAKSIAGSLEDTQDRVRDALQDAYPGAWVWIRGTIPDGNGGGSVVYAVEDPDTYEQDLYQQAYTDDGSVVALTGERTAVDLTEIVKPDPDEGSEGEPDAGAAGAPAAADTAAAGAKAALATEQAEERNKQLLRIAAMKAVADASSAKGNTE